MKTNLRCRPGTFVLIGMLVQALFGNQPTSDGSETTFSKAFYRFEDQPGEPLTDSFGGTVATVAGDPVFGVQGSRDLALDFGGASTMTVGFRPELNSSAAFSVSFWFRTDRFDALDRLVDTTGSVGPISQGYRISLGNGENTNNLFFAVQGQNGVRSVLHPEELRPCFWYYVVASYQSDDRLQLTVVRQGERRLTKPAFDSATIAARASGPVIYPAETDLNVGSARGGQAAFDGQIDELIIDDGLQTTAQLLQGYRLANPPPRYTRINLGFVPDGQLIHDVDGAIEATVASSDFWNLQDNGMMISAETWSGNFQLEAEVRSIESERYPWSKAGIMVRSPGGASSTAAGVFFTGDRGAVFQSRPVAKGLTSRIVAEDAGSNGFVRLIRIADTFYGAVSPDGDAWTSLGNFQWDQTPAALITGLAVAGQYDQPVTARLSPPRLTRPTDAARVYKLSLIDNASGQILRTLDNGDALDLDYYAGGLRVRPAVVGTASSVVFHIDGEMAGIDSSRPFDFDLSGLSNGEHTVEAIPYAEPDGAGQPSDSLKAEFHINRGTQNTPPNIVYILTDDMGFADCGFNGGQDVITPNLDRLAASGLRCTSGYVTCPICGPSRAGILTGINQYRFGYEHNTAKRGLPDPTIAPIVPEVLQGLGYTTAMIGKWHLGVKEDPDTAEREDWLNGIIAGNHTNVMPWMRGFDYTYAFNGGSSSYHPYSRRGQLFLTALGNNPDNLEVPEGSTTPRYLNLNAQTYQTTELTSRAISFIHRNKNSPFFVYLSYNAPHTPTGATDDEWAANDHILDPDRRELAGLMTGIDREVGRLMNYLRVQQLLDNTIIFFLSDNGGAGVAQNNTLNTPLSGGKGLMLEGGLRVPFLVSWKGQIPSNRDFDAPVMSIDYIATVLRAQGVPIPSYMDSVPILEDLQGKTSTLHAVPRFALFRDSHRFARLGDFKYSTSGTDDPPQLFGPYDVFSDVRYNVTEDPLAEPPPAIIQEELSVLLNEFSDVASDPTNQGSYFIEE